MICKRILAAWLHHNRPLQLVVSYGVRLLAPKNYIGVMGAIYNRSTTSTPGGTLLISGTVKVKALPCPYSLSTISSPP